MPLKVIEIDEVDIQKAVSQFKNDNQFTSKLFEQLELLSQFCQELLTAFYLHNTPLKVFAEQRKMNAPAIRKHKERCMEKLRKNFNS